jgi:hypothetical protein
MARLRFLAVAVLALAFTGNSTQTARTQSGNSYTTSASGYSANDRSCVIYSLTDMGFDADLGKWIAETIPQMIEPATWQTQGGSGALSYYAPKNVLIVNQSAAIQSKVEGFLKDLKASMPKASATYISGLKPVRSKVVPADYREPEPLPPSSYPVPAAVKPPKHLFHFIIRYEGEGIVDDNVVKFMKDYGRALKDQSDKPANAAPVSQPNAPAPSVSESLPPAAQGATSPGLSSTRDLTPSTTPTPPAVVPSTTPPQPSNAPAPKEKANKKDKPAESLPPTSVTPSASSNKP